MRAVARVGPDRGAGHPTARNEILAAMFPARHAAKLNVLEALQYE
ncbi:MAG: hypothetical protein ACYDA6_02125 [Solirubrobacteraceae bacterium]